MSSVKLGSGTYSAHTQVSFYLLKLNSKQFMNSLSSASHLMPGLIRELDLDVVRGADSASLKISDDSPPPPRYP
jgi:hypothetical protein